MKVNCLRIPYILPMIRALSNFTSDSAEIEQTSLFLTCAHRLTETESVVEIRTEWRVIVLHWPKSFLKVVGCITSMTKSALLSSNLLHQHRMSCGQSCLYNKLRLVRIEKVLLASSMLEICKVCNTESKFNPTKLKSELNFGLSSLHIQDHRATA